MFANDGRAGGIEIPAAQMHELVELHCILDGACITATINSETGENVDKLVTNIGMSSARALVFSLPDVDTLSTIPSQRDAS